MSLVKVKVRGQESVGGRRNIIHNGDFKVAQRYASKTGVNSTQYVLDRWQITNNTCHFTVSQSTDVPAGQGFSNSMKMDVTTQQSSPSAGDYALITQRFEGKHLQELMKGTSNAKKVTVSFWVKSTLTGTYVLEFDDLDNNRHHPFQYTISSANTWEKKIITFTADTTGAIDNDVNGSMRLSWWLGAGTNYTSGTYSASWQSRQSSDVNRVVGQVLFTGSTANDFYITGVQMEIGETNTEFENRPYQQELEDCMRYFFNALGDTSGGNYSVFPVNFGNTVSSGNNYHIAFQVPLPTRMRATPSLSHNIANSNHSGSGVGANTTNWNFYYQNQGWASYAGNGNMNTLSRATSGNACVQVGTYYITPSGANYDQLAIGNDLQMFISAEL